MNSSFKRKLMMPFLRARWKKQVNSIKIRSAQEIYDKGIELRNKYLEAERNESKERVKELSYKIEVINWVLNNNGRST